MQDTSPARNPIMIDAVSKYIANIKFESGDVILMHNTAFSATILDKLLSRLEEEGFTFVVPN